ncbi:MAG: hypothetical protein ACE5NM_11955 [Sedimentisphaerales bacterium]
MKQPKTARPHMRVKNILLALAIVLTILVTGARAQQSLGDIVKEYGFDWIIGRWVATTDEGDKIQLEYKWQLNRHLITFHLKWPDGEYQGMIFYRPTEDEVVQIGVDSRGGSGKGTWDVEGNKAIMNYEHTGANWEISRMAIAHSKVDANTMKAEVYEVDSDGRIADVPRYTLEYKRQKN